MTASQGSRYGSGESTRRVEDDAPDNIACEIRHGDPAAAEVAFKRAVHVVTLDLVNQRVAPSPIEPRSTLATWDAAGDRLTLRVSCQTPTGLRDELCDPVLGIPKEKVRVIVGDVGGGFGMKTSLYPEDVVVALAAHELKRPVRHTAERIEEFLGAGHGRDVTSRAELALYRDGRILALQVASLAKVGAYATPAGVVIDVGRVVNPMVVIGQLEGGAVQGIGQALCERFVYDAESGQALTASFMDYALPRASDTCRFEMTMDASTPCLTNPMGVKGVGELGTIGATPAVVNAVIDALARSGHTDGVAALQMPLTLERVWRAMQR